MCDIKNKKIIYFLLRTREKLVKLQKMKSIGHVNDSGVRAYTINHVFMHSILTISRFKHLREEIVRVYNSNHAFIYTTLS